MGKVSLLPAPGVSRAAGVDSRFMVRESLGASQRSAPLEGLEHSHMLGGQQDVHAGLLGDTLSCPQPLSSWRTRCFAGCLCTCTKSLRGSFWCRPPAPR